MIDIPIFNTALSILFILPVLIILWKKKIPLIKQIADSFLRMIVQLIMIGMILQYLFYEQNLYFTCGWIFIMIISSIYTTVERLKLPKKFTIPIVFYPLTACSIIVLFLTIFVIIRPKISFDARFIIPIFGMILGNSMNSTAIVLERFHQSIMDNVKDYQSRIAMGASAVEGADPFLKQAVQAGLMPRIMSIATMGIIALPGMMTGQILGGVSPVTAIKYQIVIMFAIFTAVAITVIFAVKLFIKKFFDHSYNPKWDLFHQK